MEHTLSQDLIMTPQNLGLNRREIQSRTSQKIPLNFHKTARYGNTCHVTDGYNINQLPLHKRH